MSILETIRSRVAALFKELDKDPHSSIVRKRLERAALSVSFYERFIEDKATVEKLAAKPDVTAEAWADVFMGWRYNDMGVYPDEKAGGIYIGPLGNSGGKDDPNWSKTDADPPGLVARFKTYEAYVVAKDPALSSAEKGRVIGAMMQAWLDKIEQ